MIIYLTHLATETTYTSAEWVDMLIEIMDSILYLEAYVFPIYWGLLVAYKILRQY